MCIAGFTRKFERSAGANAAKRSRELFLRFEIQHPDFIPIELHRDCTRCDLKIPLSMRNPNTGSSVRLDQIGQFTTLAGAEKHGTLPGCMIQPPKQLRVL